jgi:hypothetical protein
MSTTVPFPQFQRPAVPYHSQTFLYKGLPKPAVESPFSRSSGTESSRGLPDLSFFGGDKQPAKPKKNFGDYLATTSMSLHMSSNLLLFFSPWIAAGALKWKQPVQKYLMNAPLLKQAVSTAKRESFLKVLQNPSKLAEVIQSKGVSFAKLLQLNTGWQVGIYTQQPSKTLSSAISTVAMTSNMFKYRQILDCTDNLTSFLWFAGESNDIKNNVDPAHRREWDLKRFLHPFSKQPDGSGNILSSAGKYIAKDCAYSMSLKPWQEMFEAVKNYKQTNWKSPQAFQTAVGAQLNLFTFAGLFGSYLLTHYGKRFMLEQTANRLSAKLTNISKYLVVGSVIAYIPVLVRALPTWKERESFLTILGVPLSITYQVLQASPIKLDTRKGLFVIGSPMVNEGKRLNGKRYRSQVDYLKFLYAQAVKNPQLTAQDVLQFLNTHPDEIKSMSQYMEKNRVDYIIKKLKMAEQQQRHQNISLANVLLPMMKEGGGT